MMSRAFHIVSKQERFGLIDSKGRIVLPLGFCGLGPVCDEGLVATIDGRLFGVIDLTGKFTIPAIFKNLGSQFSCGLLEASNGNGFGYIDAHGNSAIDFRFDAASQFFEDRAAVRAGGLYGFIDAKGNVVVPCEHKSVRFFSNGRAVVERGGKVGFVDLLGNWAIPPMFGKFGTGNFSEGVAVVQVDGRCGLVDESGQYIVEPLYNSLSSAREGRVVYQNAAGKWGYLSTSGRPSIGETFDAATNFSGSRAAVLRGGIWSILNEHFEVVNTIKCDRVWSFVEGYAVFDRGSKSGLLECGGNMCIPPEFDSLDEIRHGLARFVKGPRHGYVDVSGNVVWSSLE